MLLFPRRLFSLRSTLFLGTLNHIKYKNYVSKHDKFFEKLDYYEKILEKRAKRHEALLNTPIEHQIKKRKTSKQQTQPKKTISINYEEFRRKKNEEIQGLDTVKVLDENGTYLGELPFKDALKKAKEVNLDLVLWNDKQKLCKIMNYKMYEREQINLQKKKQIEIQRQKEIERKRKEKMKEIHFRLETHENDLLIKLNKAQKFLDEGRIVKLVCVGTDKVNTRLKLTEVVETLIASNPRNFLKEAVSTVNPHSSCVMDQKPLTQQEKQQEEYLREQQKQAEAAASSKEDKKVDKKDDVSEEKELSTHDTSDFPFDKFHEELIADDDFYDDDYVDDDNYLVEKRMKKLQIKKERRGEIESTKKKKKKSKKRDIIRRDYDDEDNRRLDDDDDLL